MQTHKRAHCARSVFPFMNKKKKKYIGGKSKAIKRTYYDFTSTFVINKDPKKFHET